MIYKWGRETSEMFWTKLPVDRKTTSDTIGEMTSDISAKDIGMLPMEHRGAS